MKQTFLKVDNTATVKITKNGSDKTNRPPVIVILKFCFPPIVKRKNNLACKINNLPLQFSTRKLGKV
jgi:hypothetical protein